MRLFMPGPGFLMALTLAFAFSGCTRAKVSTFTDPAMATEAIHSVAVFPLRNARLSLSDAMEIDRKFTQELQQLDPSLRIIGPGEASSAVNKAGLQAELSTFLINYDTSGIPDANFLKKLGEALSADAFFQGRIVSLSQSDGQIMGPAGVTRVSVRYDMCGATSGRLLWDSIGESTVDTQDRNDQSAPPIAEAINSAVDKIIKTLPFGQ